MGKVERLGIRAKLERAREHFVHLDREMYAFTDRSPFLPVVLPQPKPNVISYGISLTESIPIGWSVILGEAIHDLRSALDNAIYELSVDWLGKTPDGMTGFPIHESSKQFVARGGERQICDTGEAVKTFVRSLQTHNDGGPKAADLLSLNGFWNRDKHRVIQPWGVRVDPSDHTFTSDPPYKGISFGPRVLHDDHTEAIRMWFSGPVSRLEVQMNGYCALSLAFDDPADPDGDMRPLWALYETATAVCLTLLSMLGKQDDPPIWASPPKRLARPLPQT